MHKHVIYKGQRVDFNAAWGQMDVELRDKAWNMTSDAQSCFDNYTDMHEEKFGKVFEVQS